MFPAPLPHHALDDPRKAAETRLYKAFASSLPQEYRVFYSVPWTIKRRKGHARDGEADFIVGHSERGILLIEVKGGGVARDGQTGKWTSRDRSGREHAIADPVEQAIRNKYALREKLASLPDWKGRPPFLGHAVAFPDCSDPGHDLALELPRKIAIFAEDLDWIQEKIEAVMDFWNEQRQDASPTSVAALDAIERKVAPTFQLRSPLGLALRRDDEKITNLTEEQFHLLDVLSAHRRAAVRGGAGTGKTVLALEKARRLADEGFRTLLTCFNRLLADDLARATAGVPRLTVSTFHSFCEEMAKLAGIELPDHPPMKAPPQYFEEELPVALEQALALLPRERFDAVVVDEGQDFRSEWWILLGMCQPEPDDSILYVFHDNKQNLFGSDRGIPADLPPFTLARNLRNTRPIHELAMRFYGGRLKAAGPDGRPPELIEALDARAVRRELSRVLHRLVREEKIPLSEIAILTGRALHKSSLAGRDQLGAFGVTHDMAGSPGRILVQTIHRFKGLDRQVAVLTDLPDVSHGPSEDAGRREALVYVGITRARGHLVIVDRPEVLAAVRALQAEDS